MEDVKVTVEVIASSWAFTSSTLDGMPEVMDVAAI